MLHEHVYSCIQHSCAFVSIDSIKSFILLDYQSVNEFHNICNPISVLQQINRIKSEKNIEIKTIEENQDPRTRITQNPHKPRIEIIKLTSKSHEAKKAMTLIYY